MSKETKEEKIEELQTEEVVNENNELETKIEVLANLLKEEQTKSLRIQAEMLNFKKRKEEEVNNFYKYANEGLLKELLGIIDNFERAIKMDLSEETSSEVNRFLEGFKMIYGNLINILTSYGVTEMESAGVEFNPNYHQAVLIEKDENKPSGVILEVLQKGYMYKDKVLRPAMVKVNE